MISFILPILFAIFAWGFITAIDIALDITFTKVFNLDNVELADENTVEDTTEILKKYLFLSGIYFILILILLLAFNYTFFQVFGINPTQ